MLEAEHVAEVSSSITTVLRLGGIYGPGRRRLIDEVRRGDATCVPGVFTNRIHEDDAANAIAHVLGVADPPAVVNVVDNDPAERCAVLAWLAARLGAPDPRRADAEDRTRVDNKRVSNARLRALGWRPTYPTFREGYAAMLDDRLDG
jgi:nucleoside-diphosphate-sugar epimerase